MLDIQVTLFFMISSNWLLQPFVDNYSSKWLFLTWIICRNMYFYRILLISTQIYLTHTWDFHRNNHSQVRMDLGVMVTINWLYSPHSSRIEALPLVAVIVTPRTTFRCLCGEVGGVIKTLQEIQLAFFLNTTNRE